MFYPDGTFLYNFDDYDNDIPGLFKSVVKNTNKGKNDLFYAANCWGRYIISGNTIKAQYYHKPGSLNDGWYDGEVWFKIIDRNTLKFIKVPDQKPAQKAAWEGYREEYPYFWAKFVYVDILPSSNCKLKKQKWFWCRPSP